MIGESEKSIPCNGYSEHEECNETIDTTTEPLIDSSKDDVTETGKTKSCILKTSQPGCRSCRRDEKQDISLSFFEKRNES